MDKDLFNENIKNAFDNFEADPPDYVLDRIKSTYRAQSKTPKKNNYLKGAIIVSVIAVLLIPVYYFTQSNKEVVIEEQIVSSQLKNQDIDKNSNLVEPEKINIEKPVEINLNNESIKSFSVFAGNDDVVCGLSYGLYSERNVEILGSWEVVDEVKFEKVKFDSSKEFKTEVTVSESGKYVFRYTVTKDGESKFDDVEIEFIDLSYSRAGDDITICDLAGELTSTGNYGNWISLQTAELFSPDHSISIVKVPKAGIYSFVWKESVLNCESFDTVSIEFVESSNLKLNLVSTPVCSYDRIFVSGLFNSTYKAIWDFDNAVVYPSPVVKNGNSEKYSLGWETGGIHRIKVSVSYKSCVDKAEIEISLPDMLMVDYRVSDPGSDVPAMVYFSNMTTVGERDFNEYDNIDFEWNFGDGNTSSEVNPDHLYLYPGSFNPVLIATSEEGCTDTIKGRTINLSNSLSEKQSNIFTPNNDGENDIFKVNCNTLKSFNCIILTRSFEKIYEWSDPTGGWNGMINGGQYASTGLYYYIIRGETFDGKSDEITGTVYLIRE